MQNIIINCDNIAAGLWSLFLYPFGCRFFLLGFFAKNRVEVSAKARMEKRGDFSILFLWALFLLELFENFSKTEP